MKKFSTKVTFELVLILFYVGIMAAQEVEYYDDYDKDEVNIVVPVTVTPTIKSASPIGGLCWNNDGSSFAYSEQNYVAVRKATDYSMLSYIETNTDEIKQLAFAPSFVHRYNDRLITLSTDNKVAARVLPDKTPLIFSEGNSSRTTTCLAINGSGDYIACGNDVGSIELYMWYHNINSFTKRQSLQSASSYIYAMDFSDDGKYLAAATDNDAIYFWNASSGETLSKIPYNSTSHLQIKFTKDSSTIITGKDEHTMALYDLKGATILEMDVKERIRAFEYEKKQNKILVLTNKNVLRFYDLETGRQTGFIEPVNQSKITSFSVNATGKTILVGHEDGSLYVLIVKDVIRDDSDPYAEGGARKFLGKLNPKKGHGVPFNGGMLVLQNPFPYGAFAEVGYQNYNLINPFYLGGIARYSMGFPLSPEEFPYSYSVDSMPTINSVNLYIPVGLCIMPFKFKLELFAEIRGGLGLTTIWNGGFLSNSYITKVYPSLYAAFDVGFGFYNIRVSAGAEYDSIRGFQLNAGLGYYLEIKKKVTKRK